MGRAQLSNFLDPYVTGLPTGFAANNLFKKPSQAQQAVAGWTRANLLDPRQTGFPAVDKQMLNEFACKYNFSNSSCITII